MTPKVLIAYPHEDTVSFSFHRSLQWLQAEHSENLVSETVTARAWGFGLVEARNELMRQFISYEEATHIWFIDTDMGFQPDTVTRLLEADKPVIGALTYGQSTISPDDLSGYVTEQFAVAYDLVVDKQAESAHYFLKKDLDIESKSPQIVGATGTGCLLISREAATRVAQEYGENWFNQVRYEHDTQLLALSEDLSFCYRLTTVGVPIYIHTGVRTNHMKRVWLSGPADNAVKESNDETQDAGWSRSELGTWRRNRR